MLAYLAVRAEERNGDRTARDLSGVRAAESELQAAEQAAWTTTRKAVMHG